MVNNLKFYNVYFKIKSQPLDAPSIINIQFNITKFNNHDCMIFSYYDHPQHGIYDLCLWS
jgi:hypothetical protein